MEVKLNNQKIIISEAKSLKELLEEKALDNKSGTAVAVNGQVISKENWSQQMLKNQDDILLITATAGG